MSIKFTASIWKEGKYYVAQAVEFGVASQGKTLTEAKKNLQEAVEVYLESQPKSYRKSLKTPPVLAVLEAAV
ncbi:type II toxin-antitoxin system HicB family antitoxin [Candidatus Uhrbacteria bacterium]|nr:type II toxin-antitoxin system HicB family antitoxin [Candidatus Uhrbacteria bacterium]